MNKIKFSPYNHIIILLFITSTLFSCASKEDSSSGESEKSKEIFPVETTRASHQDISHTLEAVGSFLPEEEVHLSAETAGRIKNLLIDEGSTVKKGELLLEIDSEKISLEVNESEAMLKEASARLANSITTLKRKNKLISNGVIGQNDLDDAKTQVSLNQAVKEKIKAKLNQAKKSLKDTRIIAPIEGVISERLVSIGEYVKIGADLVKIVDLNPLKLSFTLPEKHAGEIKIDQNVEITASPYPGETFEGKIYFISPKIDTETRTIKIKALVDNSDFRLKPGFFINARILLEKRKSLVLPESAVLVREGKILVMAVEKDIIKYKYVITGIRFNGSVEILKGITEKDIVVAYGRNEITEGTRVTSTSRK
jgi:membrane fusion protein (multidrug efflux system)